jgi:hypothetical protein
VTFELEPVVRLTMRHENLESQAEMFAGISQGWPSAAFGSQDPMEDESSTARMIVTAAAGHHTKCGNSATG